MSHINDSIEVSNIKHDSIKETIYRRRDKSIHSKEYTLRNFLHKEGSPAYISYYPNGLIHFEEYYKHGARYRRDGPAIIVYGEDGKIMRETYCLTPYIGTGKKGFWAFWDLLTEKEREHPNIVRLMVKYA